MSEKVKVIYDVTTAPVEHGIDLEKLLKIFEETGFLLYASTTQTQYGAHEGKKPEIVGGVDVEVVDVFGKTLNDC